MTKAKLPQTVRAFVFDLDGTLVDTLNDFEVALNTMLREFGRAPVPRDVVGRMVGKGNEFLLRSALAWPDPPAPSDPQFLDGDLFHAAWARYDAIYADLNGQHSQVFPGARQVLRQLRQRDLPLACLTNKPVQAARVLLQSKELIGFFDHVFGGDSFARKKPDPLPLVETCRALGVAPQNTLMVGDSSNDAAAARGAGCPVALVSYGYNHGRPIREIDGDVYVDDLNELLEIGWPSIAPAGG